MINDWSVKSSISNACSKFPSWLIKTIWFYSLSEMSQTFAITINLWNLLKAIDTHKFILSFLMSIVSNFTPHRFYWTSNQSFIWFKSLPVSQIWHSYSVYNLNQLLHYLSRLSPSIFSTTSVYSSLKPYHVYLKQ